MFTDRPTLTCPFCQKAWKAPEAVRQAILAELNGWDRRFDGAENCAEAIFDLLSQELGPKEKVSSGAASRRPCKGDST